MPYAISLLSVVPIRSEPSHRAEMVSQLLFGEFGETGEEKDDFVAIKCLYDGYPGWIQRSQLTMAADDGLFQSSDFIGLFSGEVLVNGRSHRVPFGTPVYQMQEPSRPLVIAGQEINYRVPDAAIWKVSERMFSRENLQSIISVYLETPYLWGGKSVFGTDCSGFVQQVFKLFGVKLLRDAYLQAEQGSPVESLEGAALGDLVFFRNEKGSVVHVGILLENNEIVHASGKVRIDELDEEGIIQKQTGKRTHHFHSIRRFF